MNKKEENSNLLSIYTENVELEMWHMLSNFTYQDNIEKYCKQNNIEFIKDLGIKISSAINQAKEYFDASKSVSLYTSPLLMYYGVTNLFYGFSLLMSGKDYEINHHGMYLPLSNNLCEKYIGDIKFSIKNNPKGGFYVFCQNFYDNSCDIQNSDWTIKEIFSSIPEFKILYENCYKLGIPHIIPVSIYLGRDYTLEKIEISETERFNDKLEIFKMINNFDKNYLKPEVGENVIVLKRKIISNDIGVYSLSGQKYFQIAHEKNNKRVSFPMIIYFLMGLFSLGTLSRYQPYIWNEFIRNDLTGEKTLIDRFILHSRRIIPNLFLNEIYKKRIHFSNRSEGVIDTNKEFSEEQMRIIVLDEIKKNL